MDFPCQLPGKIGQIRQVPISRHRLTRQRFWDEVAACRGLEDGKITGRPISYQWPFQEPKLEVPTIYKAYVREYSPKIWPYMVQYLHFRILKFPLILWWNPWENHVFLGLEKPGLPVACLIKIKKSKSGNFSPGTNARWIGLWWTVRGNIVTEDPAWSIFLMFRLKHKPYFNT